MEGVGTLAAGGGGSVGQGGGETLLVSHALRADGFDASEDGTGRGTPLVTIPVGLTAPSLSGGTGGGSGHQYRQKGNEEAVVAVAFTSKDHGADAGEIAPTLRSLGYDPSSGIVQTLGANQTPAIAGMAVRRLTPRECERLQGFPDDYTLVSYRGKPASDGPRYKSLGNSMAVNCMRWLGMRIAAVDRITSQQKVGAA